MDYEYRPQTPCLAPESGVSLRLYEVKNFSTKVLVQKKKKKKKLVYFSIGTTDISTFHRYSNWHCYVTITWPIQVHSSRTL